MKRSLTFLLGLGTLAICGYGFAQLVNPPSQVIRHRVSCPKSNTVSAQEFRVLSTHRWAKGVIVLYSALCPTHDAKVPLQRVFGHQVMQQEGIHWQISSTDSYRVSTAKPSVEKLVEYGISRSHGADGDRYTILYGQVLSSKVGAVEATFEDGTVLRDEGLDKAFVLISTASNVCELRMFGTDNQLLQKEALVAPRSLPLPQTLISNVQPKSRCLSLSFSL